MELSTNAVRSACKVIIVLQTRKKFPNPHVVLVVVKGKRFLTDLKTTKPDFCDDKEVLIWFRINEYRCNGGSALKAFRKSFPL